MCLNVDADETETGTDETGDEKLNSGSESGDQENAPASTTADITMDDLPEAASSSEDAAQEVATAAVSTAPEAHDKDSRVHEPSLLNIQKADERPAEQDAEDAVDATTE